MYHWPEQASLAFAKWVCELPQLGRHTEVCGRFHMLRANLSFAAPMVGASPDNIGAQRLAEGGVPTNGADSAQCKLGHQTDKQQKNLPKKLESDPN